MSYITKVIYSKYSDFSNEMDVTESGKPASVELDDLNDDTTYYTKAQLRDGNGTLLDTSDVSTFQTLAAGTISLTYVSTTRSGNNYIASYTYTSTYALSSAIMSINSINVQGLIAGNNITFTISGLTHGDAYLYTITATDIYTETGTLSGSITTTVVNEVAITSTVAAETSMRLNLSYQTDSGFRSGYGECWAMGDDPDTDQPESYAFFNEGDTYVVVPNINADTQYQFRATIELDNSTEVYSSVVVARTTAHDYSQDYFTIKNESNATNIITVTASDSSVTRNFYVSRDGGTTWQRKYSTTNGNFLAQLNPSESILVKHTGALAKRENGLTQYNKITGEYNFSVSGNIASLCFDDNFNTGSTLTMPDNAYSGLFSGATTLVSAENLVFSDYEDVSNYGMAGMFYNCSSLVTAPNLDNFVDLGVHAMFGLFERCTSLTTAPEFNNIETLGEGAMQRMFYSGTSVLTTAPLLGKVRIVGDNGMKDMFYACASITTAPDLSSVVSVGSRGMENIFYHCDSLANVSDFDSLTTVGDYGLQQAFGGCSSLETAPNFNSVTTVGVHAFDQLFTWDGNLKSASGFNSLERVSDYTFSAAYYNCTSLKTGSDIRRITAASSNAFGGMYQGCSSLSKAYAPTITWDTSKTNNWLSGVYSTGELYADSSIASGIPTSNASGCPTGWTVETAVILQSPSITFDRGDVVLTATIPQGSNAYIRYKKNNDANWIKYLTPISVAPNDIIYAQNYTETRGYEPSTVVSETFSTMQLNAPVITYDASTEYVTISDTNDAFANSGIYYTTDGTTPTSRSTLYETPFQEQVGVTVKAIVIPKNTTWYTDSNVTSKVLYAVKKLSYIHNDSMSSNPSETYCINTDIEMDNTIKFRYKGKNVGNSNGNVIAGYYPYDNNDLRMFFTGGQVYVDWGSYTSNRMAAYYNFSSYNNEIDFTVSNLSVYDNNGETYLFNDPNGGNYTDSEQMLVDCSSYWLKSLQIWKTINNVETLVFDGYAADYDGECGLWDEVSQKLFTNSNITIVGEE